MSVKLYFSAIFNKKLSFLENTKLNYKTINKNNKVILFLLYKEKSNISITK
jgi:hypothetical protein